MSEIRVHIERLIVDAGELSSFDAGALQAALAAAVERGLLAAVRAPAPGAGPGAGAHAVLRAPSVVATADRSALGERAGGALASAIAPLCVGGAAQPRGGGRA